MGVLAGGIAHDFNNILSVIVGNAEMGLMRTDEKSPSADNLRRIVKAAERAADLAKQMLAYSGKGKFLITPLNLNRLLEEMLHLLEVSISKKAVLQFDLAEELPTIEVDATQIRQIVMNLVINASEALDESGGVITVRTGCGHYEPAGRQHLFFAESDADRSYVILEIADNGCGMDQETVEKIFDPFFTTKFTGRGLGMAAVLGILRGHAGAIQIASGPGTGSVFRILLPVSGTVAEVMDYPLETGVWQGKGTVLIVDDEDAVLGIGCEMVTSLGMTAIPARNGREALELFKATPEITLVILDLTMPEMDGVQCCQELWKQRRGVKIIISSGFSEQEVSRKIAGLGVAGFIQKPYTFPALREALTGAGSG
jgi:CheY-like chemotaxis protein